MKDRISHSPKVESRLAVVICTRGRPTLDALLQSLQENRTKPAVVIIVDSSNGQIPGQVSDESGTWKSLRLVRIGASPGLPHQRNVGVRHLLSYDEYQNCDIFGFLDDDVEVSPDYVDQLVRCFDSDENLVCVGAVDENSRNQAKPNLALRCALVNSTRYGRVLLSGFATLPKADSHLSESEWVPGFAVSYRRSVLESNSFDDKIAFYGEDLEFQLRISRCGKIAISNRLHVVHNQSPLSRDSIRDHWSFSDGFRWSMTTRFPYRVKKSAVIWSTLALMLFELGRFFASGTRRYPSELLGHCDFFRRLITSKEVEKLRDSTE